VIYYLLLPLFCLIVLIFQTTLLNLLFLGKISVEVSLIIVVYAGLHLDAVKAGFLAFIMGFILDCLTGFVSGLFTLYYVAVFLVVRILSFKVYAEGYPFIVGFTFIAVLVEALFTALVYLVFYEANILSGVLKVFLAQALVACLLSPALFKALDRLEGVLNVREAR